MAAKKKEMDQLTRHSISAQKAGMSYGKWIAINRPPKETKKEIVEEDLVQHCAVCGMVIMNYRTGKKYYCHRDISGYLCKVNSEVFSFFFFS